MELLFREAEASEGTSQVTEDSRIMEDSQDTEDSQEDTGETQDMVKGMKQ